jgi:hypothetical protein
VSLSDGTPEPELAELSITDPAERWRALGFEIDDEDNLDLGGVRIQLGLDGSRGATGIASWSFRRIKPIDSIDGLPTPAPRTLRPPPFQTHPNGATGIDHVVIVSPDFDRTATALARAGLELKRDQQSDRGRQGFRRVGPSILELVQPPKLDGSETRFWGLVVIVVSLDELAQRLGDHLSEIRPAVQPGRRIATLKRSAGISPALAFMSPELG